MGADCEGRSGVARSILAVGGCRARRGAARSRNDKIAVVATATGHIDVLAEMTTVGSAIMSPAI
jgi:hypothetical protein